MQKIQFKIVIFTRYSFCISMELVIALLKRKIRMKIKWNFFKAYRV